MNAHLLIYLLHALEYTVAHFHFHYFIYITIPLSDQPPFLKIRVLNLLASLNKYFIQLNLSAYFLLLCHSLSLTYTFICKPSCSLDVLGYCRGSAWWLCGGGPVCYVNMLVIISL